MQLFRVLVIVGAGAALGLAVNGARPSGLPLEKNAFLRQGDLVVPPAEALAQHQKGALFLDARGPMFFEMSRIPGALNLPEEDFDKAFAALESTLRSRFDLVIYCSGFGCEASHLVAARLREKGIQAAILAEGLPAWQEAGYPLETGAPAR